jgi:outer membrane protein TolC
MKLNVPGSGEQKFKMGRDGSTTGNAGLAISLPLFVPSVYKAMSLTKTDVELAVEKARASKLDLKNQVTKAYYQLLLAQDSYSVLQQSYQLAEENFKIVDAKFGQGSVSEFDRISAEVQMRSVKPTLIATQNAVQLAQLQLLVLMGITANVELVIDDSLSSHETTLFSTQLSDINGLNANTTLRQMELNSQMLKKNIGLLKTNFMPTVGLAYAYKYQSLYNNNLNILEYEWANSSNLTLSVAIPLYKASNFTKLKTSRIQLQQLEWTRIDTERKLTMQQTSYRNSMAASSEQVVSGKETILQAQKAVQIAGKRYEVGMGTVLELNSSQVSLTQAQLAYNQSIYDWLIAKADMDLLTGVE